MMSAAALVNPLMTGLERKFTKNPKRSSPMTHCSIPIIKASNNASAM